MIARGEPSLFLTAVSSEVIGAAIEVHRCLGPGLLESAYLGCLAAELESRRVPFLRDVPLPVHYKGQRLDCGYRIDMIVRGVVLIELKAISGLLPIHRAQVLTYLRLRNLPVGLLINFNVPMLASGIKRILNSANAPAPFASLR